MVVRERIFHEPAAKQLLDAIGTCRKACIEASTEVPINGDVYQAAWKVKDAIDGLAEVLTGDRQHFWLKPHSTPPSVHRSADE